MAKTGKPKKPGSGLIGAGLMTAAIGALLIGLSISSGAMGAPLTWAMLLGGLILAGIGFARRVLAALENR